MLVLAVLLAPQIRDALAKSSATKEEAARAASPWSGKRVRAKTETTIYWSPAAVRPRRAVVETDSVVLLDGKQPQAGAGCRDSWVSVAGGGYLCLDSVEATAAPVRRMPGLVDDLLPFVFVHRLESKAFSYAFLPGEGASKKQLFRRGKPLDESRYALHEPSRFQGRNLEKQPVKNRNLVPGWTVAADAPVYAAPSTAADPVRRLVRHTPLLVGRRPAAKGWREVRDARGQRVLGFMKDDGKLRYWVGAAPVKGLAAGETWLDIDVGQQMIALRAFGTGPIYVTLVSSGLPERPTPLGVYRVDHKWAYRSMGNLPTSADQYFVENVPWAMYFLPYYAIHGAYWHNEFGNRRSHGCVNLAPLDARYIYERVPPWQQPGFFHTFASDQAPGAVVRVRDSARETVQDRHATGGKLQS
ncbi:MAG: L,D-transpeptidase [Deltaproteobacteria bacterium]|nr:L,D-transpeptidase [Deltaproteobacteria bacterium]